MNINARTYRTADRFDLNLEAIGYATAKQARAAKRMGKLARKQAARRAGQ